MDDKEKETVETHLCFEGGQGIVRRGWGRRDGLKVRRGTSRAGPSHIVNRARPRYLSLALAVMRNLSSVVESILKHLSVRPRVCPGGRRLSVLLPFLCRFVIPQPIQFAAVVGAAVKFGVYSAGFQGIVLVLGGP